MRLALRARAPSSTGKGERIYAIGDVHGRLDLMSGLLDRIEDHAMALPPAASTHLILLGDVIDRGPSSAALLTSLQRMQRETERLIVLRGNHEDMMLRALDGEPGVMRAWLRAGGDETLRSFGIEPPDSGGGVAEVADALAAVLPDRMIDWLRGLPLTARSGDYLFCHAGVRPGVPIKRQSREDLLWIREEFLQNDRDHGVVVVHGHSVAAEVEIRDNRIGIDTGAYRRNILTAIYLEGREREVLSAGS